MSKPFLIGFVVGLALLLVAGVGASRLHQKDAEQAKLQSELAEYRAELVDATPVQLGVLADRQRIHSKLYANYLELTKNFTVSRSVGRAESKVVGIDVHVGLGPALTEPETPESYFGELARQSDVVIRGRVATKASQITEDDGFIFTDYGILVTEVLKNSNKTRLDSGMTLTVTCPGGKVSVGGIIVKAIDHSFALLPQNSHDLVLFLKYVPETGAFRPTGPAGSFELDGSILRPLTGVGFPPGVLRDADSFLQAARAVSDK